MWFVYTIFQAAVFVSAHCSEVATFGAKVLRFNRDPFLKLHVFLPQNLFTSRPMPPLYTLIRIA